jgi:sulfur-oxidizing protein SoxX
MKNSMLLTVCASVAMMATVALGEVAPGDVVYDDNGGVPVSLTGVAGDPAAGQRAMINRKKGNCFACHVISDMSEVPFHGLVGPALDGVASRYDEAFIRGLLVNAKHTFDGTIMPAMYVPATLPRTMKKFQGTTILSAQEVEDVLSYLETLTE